MNITKRDLELLLASRDLQVLNAVELNLDACFEVEYGNNEEARYRKTISAAIKGTKQLLGLMDAVDKLPINAPIVAAFCTLVMDAGIVEKPDNVSVDTYCRYVCMIYQLPVTDRTRQTFGRAHKPIKWINQIREKIFPRIDNKTIAKIEEEVKMYG